MVMGSLRQECEVVVIGGGPGGYVAALRAADLGKEVILIEEREQMGGVCLLEGCIPSKTLLHVATLAELFKRGEEFGLVYGDKSESNNSKVRIDLPKLRSYVNSVVSDLSKGIDGLLKKRGVEVVQGKARFVGATSLVVEGKSHFSIDFQNCIIATGSVVKGLQLPSLSHLSNDERVWTSKEAVQISKIPERLAILGGGYIGLELGTLYARFGSEVSILESHSSLLKGVDKDLVDVLIQDCSSIFKNIYLNSTIQEIQTTSNGLTLTFDTGLSSSSSREQLEVDTLLVAVERCPNTDDLGLEKIGVDRAPSGHIIINEQRKTSLPHIYAIGDVTPGPMLAHKAMREGKIAAEVIAGLPSAFDNQAIPAVVYTNPEIAWAGITEQEAIQKGQKIQVGKFPLRALGRAHTLGQTEGLAKVIINPDTGLLLGVGLVGPNSSDMISEAALAIELGATLDDLLLTIHPHPTFSEAIMEAAEAAAGISVHLSAKVQQLKDVKARPANS